MKKLEEFSYVGCPCIIGIVLVVCGLLVAFCPETKSEGVLVFLFGLVCLCLCATNALLAKIVTAMGEKT